MKIFCIIFIAVAFQFIFASVAECKEDNECRLPLAVSYELTALASEVLRRMDEPKLYSEDCPKTICRMLVLTSKASKNKSFYRCYRIEPYANSFRLTTKSNSFEDSCILREVPNVPTSLSSRTLELQKCQPLEREIRALQNHRADESNPVHQIKRAAGLSMDLEQQASEYWPRYEQYIFEYFIDGKYNYLHRQLIDSDKQRNEPWFKLAKSLMSLSK